MKSKTTQDREHEENRDFWVHSDAISFYCQTAISLLNSWSFSVTTAEGYFPAASSIFVKWADWIWRHRRKHQKGTARLHMCIWQNAPELPSNGENIRDSIKDKTKKLVYHLSGLFYVGRLVLCLPEFLEFSIIRCSETNWKESFEPQSDHITNNDKLVSFLLFLIMEAWIIFSKSKDRILIWQFPVDDKNTGYTLASCYMHLCYHIGDFQKSWPLTLTLRSRSLIFKLILDF